MPTADFAVVDVVYGRIWGREQNVTFEISDFRMIDVQIDGTPARFTFEEVGDSRAHLGRFADRVQYRVRVRPEDPSRLPTPAAGAMKPTWDEIEITWEVDLEPGGYRNIGPIRTRIRPNGNLAGVAGVAGGL